ncbi:MAG: four helix bundle protein [Caldilineaceae bacterium]
MATDLEDMKILQEAETICDTLWDIVQTWDRFAQDTVGAQIVRAADSIGANIAESYGRYHYGEKIQFLYYSRGSIFETKYWFRRCERRRLIPPDTVKTYADQLEKLARGVNALINSLRYQRKTNNNPKP